MIRLIYLTIIFLLPQLLVAQSRENDESQDEDFHAEPLYNDFVVDMANEKGAMEANLAFEFANFQQYLRYMIIGEFEYGLADNLGVEIELPISLYSNFPGRSTTIPSSQFESLELSLQYTFWQNKSRGISAAGGASIESEFAELTNISEASILEGLTGRIFGLLAYRFSDQWHNSFTLGAALEGMNINEIFSDINADYALIYRFPSGNILGAEVNAALIHGSFLLHLRPQFGYEIYEDWMIGVVAGIPIVFAGERESIFFRLSKEF